MDSYYLKEDIFFSMIKQEMWVWYLSREGPLEKEMATHSSIPAGKISRTEEPGRLHSVASQRVDHDWETNTTKLMFGGKMRTISFYIYCFNESRFGR